jgi:hypothetical protein
LEINKKRKNEPILEQILFKKIVLWMERYFKNVGEEVWGSLES